MIERFNPREYPILPYLQRIRAGTGQEELVLSKLYEDAKSQNPEIARQARSKLRVKWEIDPEKDSLQAESVDIMDSLARYSEKERSGMVRRVVGFQLTKGCNGNCPFCMYGKKHGVEAKFSFDSVNTFFHKYKDLIPDEPEQIGLYWDSDPFDYRDGRYNFTDIYKAWRKIRPNSFQFISTSIPRGSENDFINFMRYGIHEQKNRQKSNDDISLGVRVSLAEHNIQRVEATFGKLTEVFLSDGYSQQEINEFYAMNVKDANRIGNIHNIGALINRNDEIRDIFSPACRDGVVLAPDMFKAVMVTAPNKYEPSGEKVVPIEPGYALTQTPLPMMINDYSGLDRSDRYLISRIHSGNTMLDYIRTGDYKEYSLPNTVDDLSLKLGRETASIGRLIFDLTKLPLAFKDNEFSSSLREQYLKKSIEIFKNRQNRTSDLIKRARVYNAGLDQASKESQQLQYYITLTEVYLIEMSYLALQADGGQSIKGISVIADIFRQVGKDQVSLLPQIIKNLNNLTGTT